MQYMYWIGCMEPFMINTMKPARLLLAAATAVVACMAMAAAAAEEEQLVPCMYIFGDSLVDNGNNNNLLSLARANYRPYGVDFPAAGGPPGRFTNGLTVVDLLADLLGFRPPFIPAYAMARGGGGAGAGAGARGLNFASGAAGIRPETGNNLGRHYPLSEQVSHFRAAARDMAGAGGNNMSRCIFYVGMGSNDYLNNYFMPGYYTTAQDYDPPAFADFLLQDYSRSLADLYHLGARKFVVAGVGQIGCIPYELARLTPSRRRPSNNTINNSDVAINIGGGGIVVNIGGGGGSRNRPPSPPSASSGSGGGGRNRSSSSSPPSASSGGGGGRTRSSSSSSPPPASSGGGCNERINDAIAIYNKGLLSMVKRLNRGRQLPGARLVFLDTVEMGKELAASAAAHGFTVLDRGCCGVGRNNGQITCLPLQRPCDDRSKYVFWDAFHPTEAANRIYATKAFNSTSTAHAYPINISQLAAI